MKEPARCGRAVVDTDMGEVDEADELEVDRDCGVIVLHVVRGVDLSRGRRFLNQLLT